MAPLVRHAARALLIDESLRLLLFFGELPDRAPWWFAPGGALEQDETHEDALVRELLEETGLVVEAATLRAPVWIRDSLFTWQGRVERHLERFYLVRVTEHDVDTSQLEPAEAGVIRAHRWWTLDQIRASQEQFSPADLAKHLEPLLQGKLPAVPVEVGH
ncbi:MAG TPA: NUDIX domain-containing protein [Candidatus Dormibacteraeota bacterium]|nr:NUDIX domain-containing protein [Candidatus Dormibacteraeota bacterium]